MSVAVANREKAIEAALAKINKDHGAGSIMYLGSQEREKVGTISTGSVALDVALGVGGLPRGRVIEIYGPESSGKCITKDALIPTNWGLLSVEELFERCGQPASCTSRTTDVSHLGLQVVNEHGELEAVSALTHNNRRPVLRIQTETGKHVKVTENHPVRILNERGMIVWRKAGDLVLGDFMVGVHAADSLAKDHLSTDEALMLGYLVGDGHYVSHKTVMFSQVDRQVSAEFSALVSAEFPEVIFKTYAYKPNDMWIHNIEFRTALATRYGLDQHLSALKEIPLAVRQSGGAVQAAFLSAYFECDGWVEPQSVNAATASEALAHQLQVMLTGLGLVCTIHAKFVPTYPDRVYWTVTITAGSVALFHEKVGFRSERRSSLAEQTARPASHGPEGRDMYAGLPNLTTLLADLRDSVGGDREYDGFFSDVTRAWIGKPNNRPIRCTTERLEKVLEWADARGAQDHPLVVHLRALISKPYTYERVVLIEDMEPEPTFDVVVPGSHSFVANGLAVHNTTLTLHAVAAAQKAGGLAAFIDAEHALDPEYAAHLGVDINALLVSQPDTGEQALEIADTLIRSGAVDIIVIDSVAALVPRAEIEGDMGASLPGLQARLMSQALRKITGALSQTNTTIIFINQLREKIGVTWGSPETTTGGKALKFYASVRLDIRRIGSLKDGEVVVGNRTKVTVAKNKVAPPFKKVEFDIIFGEGISREGDIIDMGVEHGFIIKSGAWFSTDGGDQLGQGKEKTRAFLKDNPALAEEIEQKILAKLGIGEAFEDEVEAALPDDDAVAKFEQDLADETETAAV